MPEKHDTSSPDPGRTSRQVLPLIHASSRETVVSQMLSIVIALGALSGCSGLQAPNTAPVAEPLTVEPIEVERGDITSVVTLEVVVEARPSFALLAPTTDRVNLGRNVLNGKAIEPDGYAFTMGEESVTVDTGGIVTPLVSDWARVQIGVPVATVEYPGFGVVGDVPVAAALRLSDDTSSARVSFRDGPGVLECIPKPLADAKADKGDDNRHKMKVLCLLPEESEVVAGLPGLLGLTTGNVSDALVLPVTAVVGIADKGEVLKVVGSRTEVVSVGLGITDGISIEITSGLAEGDLVMPFGPHLRQTVNQ